MCSFAETTHTPQGDGNHGLSNRHYDFRETTHTPQGEGNPSKSEVRACLFRNNPHPARGRKLRKMQGRAARRSKQPTPRKGTETAIASRAVSYPIWKQPTPRKRTETRSPPHAQTTACGNNPHPARGRKPPACLPSPAPCRNNPHPARGRKLIGRELFRDDDGNNPHPARGRKPVVNCLNFFCDTKYFPPQGDGNPFS